MGVEGRNRTLCRRHCLAAWTHAPLSFLVGERVKNGDVFFGHSFDLGAREVMAAYKAEERTNLIEREPTSRPRRIEVSRFRWTVS
jgi:hypothetical protein